MRISKKSSVVALTIATATTTVVGFISNIALARLLPVEDIGIYRQNMLVFSLVTPFLMMGIPNALYYFLALPEYEKEQKRVLSANMVLLSLPALLLTFFLACGGNTFFAHKFNNPALETTLLWQLPRPLLTIPVTGICAVLIFNNKAALSSWWSVISGIFVASGVLAAAISVRSYTGPLLFDIASLFITTPVTVWLCWHHSAGKAALWDPQLMKRMFLYGLPLGVSIILGTVMVQMNGAIVSVLGTPSDYAIFSTGAREIPFISSLSGSVATVILAELSSLCAEGKYAEGIALFRKSSLYLSVIMFPVTVFLLFYGREFILILYTTKYEQSVLLFQIYLSLLPLRIAQYAPAFIALGQTKAVMYRSIGTFVVGTAFCALGMYFGKVVGACIGMVLCSFVWEMPYNLYVLAKGFHCRWWQILPFAELGKVFSVSLIAAILPACISFISMPLFPKFILAGVVYALVYCIINILYIDISKDLFRILFAKISGIFAR